MSEALGIGGNADSSKLSDTVGGFTPVAAALGTSVELGGVAGVSDLLETVDTVCGLLEMCSSLEGNTNTLTLRTLLRINGFWSITFIQSFLDIT